MKNIVFASSLLVSFCLISGCASDLGKTPDYSKSCVSCQNAEDTEDATLTYKIINDTTIEIIDNILLDIENDINSITDVFESKDYLWKDVVVTLLYNIENQDFLDLAKCKVTASQLHYETDYTYSPKVISQMYNWMLNNYGNYKIRNRW